MSEESSTALALSADIVSSFVANNSVSANDLPGLIHTIYKTIAEIGTGAPAEAAPAKAPAVPIKKSITPEYLVCLEDGRHFKSLKRHLRTSFKMSPEEYRAKWGLPTSYPMVAPAYAEARSRMAKESGLGQGGRQAAKPAGRATKAAAGS